MAKENKVVAVAVKKPKSGKAAEKKAANIAAAAERLRVQQALCKMRDEQRKKAIAKLTEQQEQQRQAAERQERVRQNMEAARLWREQQAQFQADYVAAALAGPHASDLQRWLMGRSANFERVSRFFNERPKFKAPQVGSKAA